MRVLDTRALVFGAVLLLTSCVAPSREWIAEQDNNRIAAQRAAAQAASQTAEATKLAQMEGQVRLYMGESYWVARKDHLLVCTRASDLNDCTVSFGHFKVGGFQPFTDDEVWLQVTFDGKPTGWTPIGPSEMLHNFRLSEPEPEVTIYPSFLDHLPKKVADERRKLPGIAIGMDEVEVMGGAWGKPRSSRVWNTPKQRTEEWYYPDGNALFFRDGKLYGYKN